MIGKLCGKPVLVRNNYVIVDVRGVGYKVMMTEIALGAVSGQEITELFIHTYVREDQLALYGFLKLEELEMFELLIGISGIGPKAALGILTIASVQAIKMAIVNNDSSILTRVSGVGKKTAERVILELHNKIDILPDEASLESVQSDQDVVEALVAMGYRIGEARDAAKAVPKEVKDISERIRHALKMMQK
jgi:Holliday junction DNA helicase RuvA